MPFASGFCVQGGAIPEVQELATVFALSAPEESLFYISTYRGKVILESKGSVIHEIREKRIKQQERLDPAMILTPFFHLNNRLIQLPI